MLQVKPFTSARRPRIRSFARATRTLASPASGGSLGGTLTTVWRRGSVGLSMARARRHSAVASEWAIPRQLSRGRLGLGRVYRAPFLNGRRGVGPAASHGTCGRCRRRKRSWIRLARSTSPYSRGASSARRGAVAASPLRRRRPECTPTM